MKQINQILAFIVIGSSLLQLLAVMVFKNNPPFCYVLLGFVGGCTFMLIWALYSQVKQLKFKEIEMSPLFQTALATLVANFQIQQNNAVASAVASKQAEVDAANATIAQLQDKINQNDSGVLAQQLADANNTIAQLQANLNSVEQEDIAAIVAATPTVEVPSA
jgi:hypothetical protein